MHVAQPALDHRGKNEILQSIISGEFKVAIGTVGERLQIHRLQLFAALGTEGFLLDSDVVIVLVVLSAPTVREAFGKFTKKIKVKANGKEVA